MNRETAVRVTYFLLRVVSGFMFFQAGALKLFGWYGGMPPGNTLEPWSQVWIGAVMEVVFGLLIMLGFLTRISAFLASGEMAVAYWQFHFKPELFWPVQNQGQPAVLYCFIFLFIAAYGGGAWSLDALLSRKNTRTP
jgi:putative oxidoreductase